VMENVREASHAGSWYTSRGKQLRSELDAYLGNAKSEDRAVQAIIGPHAGYSYCGETLAWAYKNVNSDHIDRIILIGPSHRMSYEGLALSSMSEYETPLGNISIDTQEVKKLLDTRMFGSFDKDDDEEEHSLEMHLPFIKRVMGEKEFTLVPMLAGQVSPSLSNKYAGIFEKYIDDPHTLIIISTDFCHWGSRFGYTYYEKKYKKIHESITALDKRGMEAIESGDPNKFWKYITSTRNTICGRHAILVLMSSLRKAMAKTAKEAEIKFVHYSQSSQCKSFSDSSVSYAAGVVFSE